MDQELFKAAVRMAISLPLVAALAYFILKYSLGRRATGLMGQRRLRLLEQVPLGPKATISLIQVGQRYYLLAHQDGAMTVVREMDELPGVIPECTQSAPEFRKIVSFFSAGWLKLKDRRKKASDKQVEGERRER